jgi:protein-disulfide isomerase
MRNRLDAALVYVITILLLFQGVTSLLIVKKLNSVAVAVSQNSTIPTSQQPTNAASQQGTPTGSGQASTAAPPPKIVQVDPGNGPIRGDTNAPVTIVEFSDFECPFCAAVQPTLKRLSDTYKGKIRIVFRDYPLANLHANAVPAAIAARCAGDQGAYWEYHDLLFANAAKEHGTALTGERLQQYARDLRLNEEAFRGCVESQKYKDAVNQDFQAGEGYGVTGTPTFFINGRMVTGAEPYESFVEVIEQALGSK